MSNLFEIDDEIESIEYLGVEETIDINVSGNRLFYANDILTHNSAVEEVEFDHSHISGGISKINTADNVFGIFTSRAMRERGRYQIQIMKTRSSSGVGTKVDLEFNMESLRITDPGEEAQDSYSPAGGPPKIATSVMDQIKTTTRVHETVAVPDSQVNSTKLKNMLAGLRSKSE